MKMMPHAADLASCPASRLLRDIGPYRIAQYDPVQYIERVPSTRALRTALANTHSEHGMSTSVATSSQIASDATFWIGTPAAAARKPLSAWVIGSIQPATCSQTGRDRSGMNMPPKMAALEVEIHSIGPVFLITIDSAAASTPSGDTAPTVKTKKTIAVKKLTCDRFSPNSIAMPRNSIVCSVVYVNDQTADDSTSVCRCVGVASTISSVPVSCASRIDSAKLLSAADWNRTNAVLTAMNWKSPTACPVAPNFGLGGISCEMYQAITTSTMMPSHESAKFPGYESVTSASRLKIARDFAIADVIGRSLSGRRRPARPRPAGS